MARLLFAHKIASKEQIMDALGSVSPQHNVGEILLARSVITEDIYQKLVAFMQKNNASRNEAEEPEIKVKSIPQPVATYHPVFEKEDLRQSRLPEKFVGDTGKGQLKLSIPVQLNPESTLDDILCFARKRRASDVHLCPGTPVILRQYGNLTPVSQHILIQSQLEKLVKESLSEENYQNFLARGDLEFIHTIEGGGRYRMTLMRENFGFDLTARVIPMSVMTYEQSGLPEVCKELTRWAQGMVLVTGPIGSGKSSSLAVLVELINQNRDDHIITIDAPIEFIYPPGKCQITQRELNLHTLSQENALRAALRQDPDIIVIGELRNLKSIQLAVSAAETGHLVLATMNTANAMRTIYRLIDSFPPEEQGIIRNMVSLSLRGVISQQLIPLKDGSGVIPAYEVLMVTTAISNLIRKNNSHLIESAMVTGKASGMVLLDDSLEALYKQGKIAGSEAFYRSINPKRFAAVKEK
jgi:twitching motility protein PilT